MSIKTFEEGKKFSRRSWRVLVWGFSGRNDNEIQTNCRVEFDVKKNTNDKKIVGSYCCGIFHCVWNISASAGSINNQDCIFLFLRFIAFVHSYITIVLNILLKITMLTSFMVTQVTTYVTTYVRTTYVRPQTELGKGSLLFLAIWHMSVIPISLTYPTLSTLIIIYRA